MTSEQRLVLSQTYYKFYTNFTKQIDDIKKNFKNKKIDFYKSYSFSNYTRKTFILVSLKPKSNKIDKKVLICSHFDGHNLTDGGTAYDDAINVVSMLGTIEALITEDIELKFFFFFKSFIKS